MKKLLSALLAVAMIMCTLVPMAFADAPAAVVIPAEGAQINPYNYKDNLKVDGVAATETLGSSGQQYAWVQDLQGTEATLNIPVDVQQAGWYMVDAEIHHFRNAHANWTPVTLKAGDTKILDNACFGSLVVDGVETNIAGTYATPNYTQTEGGVVTIRHFKGAVYLNEGVQDLTYHVTPAANNSGIKFGTGFLTLTPMAAMVQISKNDLSNIKLDGQAVTAADFNKAPASAYTGIAMDSTGTTAGGLTISATSKLTGEFPVSVARTGWYDLEALAMRSPNGNYSVVDFLVDGTKVADNKGTNYNSTYKYTTGTYTIPGRRPGTGSTTAGSETAFVSGYSAAVHFGNKVYLTAGDHTVGFSVNTAASATTKIGFGIQDIALVYNSAYDAPAADVAAEGTTTIQAETYENYVMLGGVLPKAPKKGSNPDATLGETVIGITETVATKATIEIPVNVATEGTYSLDAILSRSNMYSTSIVSVYANGELVLNNATYRKNSDSTSPDYNTWIGNYQVQEGTWWDVETSYESAYRMRQFQGTCELTEGKNVITIEAAPRLMNDGKVGFYAESIALTLLRTKAVIAATGTSTIEFEDYNDEFLITYSKGTEDEWSQAFKETKRTFTRLNGTTVGYLGHYSRGTAELVQTIEVDVAASGYYTMQVIAAEGNYYSEPIIAIDGVVADVTTGAVQLSTADDPWFDKAHFDGLNYNAFARDYIVYLEAGERTITTTLGMSNTQNTIVTYAIDSVSFTPYAGGDSATVAGNVVNVTADYVLQGGVSGQVIVALYNGNKLVGYDIVEELADDSLIINATVAYSEAPDTAKVFVWSDIATTFAPVVAAREIAVTAAQ